MAIADRAGHVPVAVDALGQVDDQRLLIVLRRHQAAHRFDQLRGLFWGVAVQLGPDRALERHRDGLAILTGTRLA